MVCWLIGWDSFFFFFGGGGGLFYFILFYFLFVYFITPNTHTHTHTHTRAHIHTFFSNVCSENGKKKVGMYAAGEGGLEKGVREGKQEWGGTRQW